MNPELDTLATRLYVTIDDALIEHPEWAPERPTIGITPKLSAAELVTLAVIQALLGFTSEAQFIRHAHAHLRAWFPYIPDRPGYNKRLRRSGQLLQHATAYLARECPSFDDALRLVDSTPVDCGRSRESVKRSDLAGWAQYGYCASHSRYFWGLGLHLITTPSGLPVAYALAGAKADERDTALDMIAFNNLDRHGLVPATSKHSDRSSNQSTRPSKASLISNATAAEHDQASAPESCNASSPSPPRSGTTKPPSSQDQPDHSPPTTTDPLELII